ncbi:MAG: YfhO family protein [Bacteroidales bacterium]|jgi:hypothetical protein|nr:YfhO family protein [Bacteroidales bacterium]
MKNINLKKFYPYAIAIAFFAALTLIYCSPTLEGKSVKSGDASSFRGMYQEAKQHLEKTGEATDWTNSMFSGMPTYQIGGGKINYPFVQKINTFLYDLSHGFMPPIALQIMGLFIGGFILMLAFGLNIWLAVNGALAIAFSSYFFILLDAGHESKALALGFLAAIVGGFKLIYDKKYLWGAVCVAVYCMLGITWHIQMTYYVFMLIGILFFVELYNCFKEKHLKTFLIASLVFLGAVGVGIGTRTSYFTINQHYLKETMRGGHSELTPTDSGKEATGLDLDYATAWSYDIDETLTLLIPNFKGGASGAKLGKNSNTYEVLIQHGQSQYETERMCSQMPMYWGTQPFTSGPVYVGAVVCFLFVLGLFIVKTPYKWGVLIATVFSILLAWGRNFMPLTELFMNYFPFYNKFRAVSSILIVAEFTMPLLGFLALKQIMEDKIPKQELLKNIKLSAYITGGICLFFALFGSAFFSFTSEQDMQFFANWPDWLSNALIEDRKSWLRMDAIRSAIFIALVTFLLIYFEKGKIKLQYFYVALIVLILADMWPIDKRYLNNDKFVSQKSVDAPFPMTEADQLILQDPDPHYRVLNVTTNTFNESATSFYHKSIGGYSPAKLRRYQDMIEHHIGRNNVKVFNMLNTKYFIVPGQGGTPDVQRNIAALGNVWFVDSVRIVEGPNAEIGALNNFEPADLAIIDTPFVKQLLPFTPPSDSASIVLTSYAPNVLTYKSSNENDGLAVFSEVFYPNEWFAWIDGEPVDIMRVNYILRAINIPAGDHEIKMEFIPVYRNQGDKIGLIFNLILFGLIATAIFFSFRKPETEE